MKRLITYLLNLFISKRCFVCGKELPMKQEDDCCADCKPFLEASFVSEKKCEKCGRGLNYMYNSPLCSSCTQNKYYFDKAVSVFDYDGHIKDAIHRMKFAKKPYLTAVFAKYLRTVIPAKENAEYSNCFDYIVYPPVNRKTLYKRGYNQSELLSLKLSESLGIPVLKNALQKKKQNEVQSRLSGKDRFKNISGLFFVNPNVEKLLSDKRVLLIDDVFTTGATASECAKVLKQKKSSFVMVATIASTREI